MTWIRKRKHRLPVEPGEAAGREVKAAENLGEAREAHAQQKRARADEASLKRSFDDWLDGNGLSALLRNAIMRPGEHRD